MPRGVPQIEITYDVDANGILNVTACEKSTGKSEKITVTNEKGRLSQEDVDRMVKEAEQFKEDDEKKKEQVESRNGLESYAYQVKQTLDDPKLKDNFTEDDRTAISDKSDEVIAWLDDNVSASTEELKEKQKELESVFNPIMQRVYQSSTGGQSNNEVPTENPQSNGPTVEEID